MKKNKYISIETIISISKKGGMYILVDDENRENEGDLVFSASDVNAEKIKPKEGCKKKLEICIESCMENVRF